MIVNNDYLSQPEVDANIPLECAQVAYNLHEITEEELTKLDKLHVNGGTHTYEKNGTRLYFCIENNIAVLTGIEEIV